jgi:hypothetical protein
MRIYTLRGERNGDVHETAVCGPHERYMPTVDGARVSVRPADAETECAFCRSARLTRPPERPLTLGRPNYQD